MNAERTGFIEPGDLATLIINGVPALYINVSEINVEVDKTDYTRTKRQPDGTLKQVISKDAMPAKMRIIIDGTVPTDAVITIGKEEV